MFFLIPNHSLTPFQLSKQEAQNFIEVFMNICSRHPSPMASRAFHIFSRFLLNKENRITNMIVKQEFLYSKFNMERLGIRSYFGYFFMVLA